MKIYNTLKREKKEFIPRDDKKIQMFVCGPTVYDYIHIGNARTFVIFDVVAKYLRYRGYDLKYIQNITDIEDKIIDRAAKEGVDPLEYASKYTQLFKEDMQSLGVTSPEYKNATDHIPQVIEQVQKLLAKGSGYIIEGDGIYFDLSTFPEYGQLSGRTAGMADDAVSRIDDSDKKRNRGDFALWKFSKVGEPTWPAPLGDGRPGWHIEDTAITEHVFGPQYDIHGGGQDLIFPHHEAEIAQQESASGLRPFVKYWMHSGFLVNKEAKMSKSTGNFTTVRDMLTKYSAPVLRLYFLSSHYRSPLDYNDEILESNSNAVKGIAGFLAQKQFFQDKIDGGHSEDLDRLASTAMDKIVTSLDDDFNIPSASAHLFELISASEPYIKEGHVSEKLDQVIDFFDSVIGIMPLMVTAPQEVYDLADLRESKRQAGDYKEADNIRSQVESLGYSIDDTAHGPLVKKL